MWIVFRILYLKWQQMEVVKGMWYTESMKDIGRGEHDEKFAEQ